uniref:Nematode cuticle collagen N-terminal domain-containing protein n=1 Tax=Globodera rostochiensis TaxID=31243 RepID=A0A914HDW1_GLORO
MGHLTHSLCPGGKALQAMDDEKRAGGQKQHANRFAHEFKWTVKKRRRSMSCSSASSSSRLFALLGILFSTCALLGLLLLLPIIMYKANNLRAEIEEMSGRFKQHSDRVWHRMMEVDHGQIATSKNPTTRTAATIANRSPRSSWNKQHFCQGCHSLVCALGTPGPNGLPGPDGAPGEMGRQGQPGEDGFDVQLQPEADLPCVICPAGPPGQRGPQGERGRIGGAGSTGEFGFEGKEGIGGPNGARGHPGALGAKGVPGRPGLQGDQVVAGIGIKGPPGPVGAAGPKGPHGAHGKPSRDVGMAGKIGQQGPTGQPGQAGLSGEPGGFGPPGEPGEPASYCPSDCGVSHIKAPNFGTEPAEKSP